MEIQADPFSAADKRDNYCDAEAFRVEAQRHNFTFYPNGPDRLQALLQRIESAQKRIDLFYYMFQDDHSGRLVRDALAQAAARGVDVRLIVDAFGSDSTPDFFDPIIAEGGAFCEFAPRWNLRYLMRNHQKFVIIDNACVMTGGSNISDHYFDRPENNGWCDLGVAIEGRVVDDFTRWFALLHNWSTGKAPRFRELRRIIAQWDSGDNPVQLLLGGPLILKSGWAHQFRRDAAKASRLDLVTAYFGPPHRMVKLMGQIAKRGAARFILAGKSDLNATIEAARYYYRKLSGQGAHICEFLPCKLHMKLCVMDTVSYFGSANFDRRSTRINIELMVRVEDQNLAEKLRGLMDHLEAASTCVNARWYEHNSTFLNRLRWRFFHWISVLDYRLALAASSE